MFGRTKKLESRIFELQSSVAAIASGVALFRKGLSVAEASIAAGEALFEQRLAAAEARMEARVAEVLARVGGDPNERMRFLLDAAVEDLRGGLAQALEHVRRADALAAGSEARARGEGEHQPRQSMVLGKVHRAPFTGYVSVFQARLSGYERVELLVGPDAPPSTLFVSP